MISGFGDDISASLMDSQVAKPWWQPLLSLVNVVLLGYCLKAFFGWPPRWTTLLRRFTFNILLPIYVLRNMWLAHVDQSMFSIAKASALIHIIQALFWLFLYRNVRDKSMKGWLLMISQGCLTSFFYTNLASHPNFGTQAVAICLLFDIGGNTPCAQGLLWGIAAYFSTSSSKQSSGYFETAFSSPLLPCSVPVSGTMDDKHFALRRIGNQEAESLLGSRIESSESEVNEKRWQDIVCAVLYQPILPAFILGIILSVSKVGCPAVVDYVMETVGLFFKPSLYLLIGLYSEIITDVAQLRMVFTALGLRYLFAGFMALMIWLWMPFGELERTTMALTLLSPVSTMTMYLAAEYNYPTNFVAMSATLTTISVFISFVVQEAVMRSF
jgi:predicted permease